MKRKPIPYEECHKEIDGILYKQCSICEEWFPCTIEHFYKHDKNLKDKLSPYCKTCEKAKNTKWTKNNIDKHTICRKNDYIKSRDKYLQHANKQKESGYMKEWRKNNTDKTKQYKEKYSNKKHKIKKKEWLGCKEYFNNTCAYCGMTQEEHYSKFKTDFHKEHVDCDGSDDLSNCVPSCKSCNCSKHTEKLEDWYTKDKDFFSRKRLNKIHKWINKDYKLY